MGMVCQGAMRTNVSWKNEINDLRDRAAAVVQPGEAAQAISPRAAAKCMVGIVRLVARRWTPDEMQRTCAELARHDAGWATSLGMLPHKNGVVSEQTQLIAAVARGLLPLAGVEGVRAALSFWASEDDPSIMSDVAQG